MGPRWQVRREFAVITRAAGLGEEWAPARATPPLRLHLSASGVRIEDISDPVGHSGTAVTESVYRHEIRSAPTTGATAMALPVWLPKIQKGFWAKIRNPF